MKVFYTNADCLSQSKKDELENYIKNFSPDIIGITEIFPKRSSFINQEIFYHLENYDMFLSNINEGRGVAIYTKKSLNADAVKVESPFKESVWCKIQLQNHDALILGCLFK